MTAQELASQILAIAQHALAKDKQVAIYISDNPGIDVAQAGLEAIIKLCREQGLSVHGSGQSILEVPPSQEAYKQYEKKEVSHAKNAKD